MKGLNYKPVDYKHKPYSVDAADYEIPPLIEYDTIIFNTDNSDPDNITGDINGPVIQEILGKFRRCVITENDELGNVSIVFLDNDNSNIDEGGNTVDLENNNVMVYMPEFYYKIDRTAENLFQVSFALEPASPRWVKVNESLIGAYKATVSEYYKTESKSGKVPTVNTTQAAFLRFAQSNGIGFTLVNYEQHQVLALLGCAKYGTKDITPILGAGTSSTFTANGNTNSLGNNDTVNTTLGSPSFLGIEGIYGGIGEFCSGITTNNGVISIQNPVTGTARAITVPQTVTFPWVQEILASESQYFDVLPMISKETGGDYYNTIFIDPQGASYTNGSFVRSGNYVETRNKNLFYGEVRDSFTEYNLISSRLAFYGNIKIMKEQKKYINFKGFQRWAVANSTQIETFIPTHTIDGIDYYNLASFKAAWPSGNAYAAPINNYYLGSYRQMYNWYGDNQKVYDETTNSIWVGPDSHLLSDSEYSIALPLAGYVYNGEVVNKGERAYFLCGDSGGYCFYCRKDLTYNYQSLSSLFESDYANYSIPSMTIKDNSYAEPNYIEVGNTRWYKSNVLRASTGGNSVYRDITVPAIRSTLEWPESQWYAQSWLVSNMTGTGEFGEWLRMPTIEQYEELLSLGYSYSEDSKTWYVGYDHELLDNSVQSVPFQLIGNCYTSQIETTSVGISAQFASRTRYTETSNTAIRYLEASLTGLTLSDPNFYSANKFAAKLVGEI